MMLSWEERALNIYKCYTHLMTIHNPIFISSVQNIIHASHKSFFAPAKAATLDKTKIKTKRSNETPVWWWKFKLQMYCTIIKQVLQAYLSFVVGTLIPSSILSPIRCAWHVSSPHLFLFPHFVENVSVAISWCRVALIPLTKLWNSSTFIRLPNQKLFVKESLIKTPKSNPYRFPNWSITDAIFMILTFHATHKTGQ